MMMTLFLTLAMSLFTAARAGEDAKPIVEKVLQASGGVQRLKELQSRKFQGTVTLGGVASGTFQWYAKRPDFLRIDFDFGGTLASQGFDGTQAWQLQPAAFGGSGEARPLAGDAGEAIRQNAEFDSPFLDHVNKGHRIESLGLQRLGERETHHLRLTRENGNVTDYYVDSATHLVVKVVNTRDIPQLGGAVEVELLADDYREVDGLMIPHHFVTLAGGQTINELRIEQVQLDIELSDDLFDMPSN